MAKARNSGQIYIYREIDDIIQRKMDNQEGKVLFIHGQGGVGKSTLLRKFKSYDEKPIPTVFIDLKEQTNTTMVNILLDESVTFVKNCPKFEMIREMIHKEPRLLAHILESYNQEANSAIKQYKKEDEEFGLIVKTLWDIVKVGAKFFQRKYETQKEEIRNYTEFALIQALREDFQPYGLFLIDTFEKIKHSDIISQVDLKNGKISKRYQELHCQLKDYIEGLIGLMVEHTTFIIAGRNRKNDLSMELDEEDIEEWSLDKFSPENIQQFFNHFAKKNKTLGVPSDKKLITIETLTKGNPLLVSLFAEVAKEYRKPKVNPTY